MLRYTNKITRALCLACALLTGACGDERFFALRLLPPAAANAPRQVRLDEAILFAEPDGKPLLLNLYRPAWKAGPLPFVVLVFGGSWQRGSRDQLMEYAYDLAANGYAAATIDIRLAEESARFPAQVSDVVDAVSFLRDKATEFDLDPQRAGLFGASSGAHIALLAGMPRDLSVLGPNLPAGGHANIKLIVSLFAPTNLLADLENPQRWQIRAIESLLGVPIDESAALRKLASPVEYVRADGPAVLTIHGDADTSVPVSQAREFVSAMQTAGQRHTYVEVPGMPHALAAVWITPEAQGIRAPLLQFLRENL